MVLVSPDGFKVELILVQKSLRRPPREYLRVTRWGEYIADCASAQEVAQHVDLTTLKPGD